MQCCTEGLQIEMGIVDSSVCYSRDAVYIHGRKCAMFPEFHPSLARMDGGIFWIPFAALPCNATATVSLLLL